VPSSRSALAAWGSRSSTRRASPAPNAEGETHAGFRRSNSSATAVTALLTALASYRTSILAAVAIAAGLTVLCVLIFVLALQLRLPLLGPWLSFSS